MSNILPSCRHRTRPRIALNEVSLAEQRILISKDTDFFYAHLLHGRPWKLLLVRTGNISTRELCNLIERNLPSIEEGLQTHTLVEVDHSSVRPMA